MIATPSTLTQVADLLAMMRRTHRKIDQLPAELRPTDLATAYRIQDMVVDRIAQRLGGSRIGFKVACTNRLAQEQLRIDAPLFGQLLSMTSYPSPRTLPASDFSVRIVEAEFGVVMGEDVPPSDTPYTAQSIQPFIDRVYPSIEIVSHRFTDWSQAGAPSVAADNAIHGAWVYGEPFAGWRAVDLASVAVTLTVNGKLFDRGSGANVLGNPLNVVAWLANELPKYGKQLTATTAITSGVVMNVYLAEAGDQCVADFGEVGKVEVSFA